jgi:hypothetical protein
LLSAKTFINILKRSGTDMAFTVEDGTGLAAANAYISVAAADTYFLDRSITSWVGSTAQKQAAVIKATDYIEARWSSRFMGRKQYAETPQALSFPRVNIIDRNGQYVTGIPEKLKRATAEYALRALGSELLPDPTIHESGLAIVAKREKVGPLEEETQFQANVTNPTLMRPYPAADRLLEEYVTSGATNYR